MQFFHHNQPAKRGFTLVELLVVVAIMGLLISIVTVSLSAAQKKSRDARRIADVKNLQLALATYYNDNLKYPASLGTLVTDGYMSVLPRDPKVSGACTSGSEPSCYVYTSYRSGTGPCNSSNLPVTYQLGAVLEDTGNSALVDDVDFDFSTSYGVCTPGVAFNGTSVDCSNTAGTIQPGGTELCYSQKPN